MAPAQEGEGTLNLSFTLDGEPLVETKAVTHVSPEKKINSLFVIVTDDADATIIEQSFSVYPNADGSYSCSKNLKAGDKILYVFANTNYDLSQDSFSNYYYWYSSNPSLSNNSWNSNRFMMYGTNAPGWVSLSKGGTSSCTINLRRVLNRVTISNITNNLRGNLTLGFRGAYLSNLKLKPNPDGADDWANKFGRGSDGSAPVFDYDDGVGDFVTPLTVEQRELSCFWVGDTSPIMDDPSETIYEGGDYYLPSYNSSVKGCRLYYYANDNAINYVPYSSETEYTPQRTKLVLVCDIPANSGKIYYYPIPLDSESLGSINNSRDFAITINNLGVLDPNAELAKNDYDVGVKWAGWSDTVSWIDDSTPVYKVGEFDYQSGHNYSSYVAQRMYLKLPVDNQKQSVIDDITFTATLTPEGGSPIDASSWITTTYDSSNKVYNLNIACRVAGELKVKALYDDIYLVAQKSLAIYAPVGTSNDVTLLLTGANSSAINVAWKTTEGNTLSVGNTTTLTDGEYFDSALYASLLGSPATNSVNWDTSPAGFSCTGTNVSGSTLYLRVNSFGSTVNGMLQMARLMKEYGYFGGTAVDRRNSQTPLVAKYRLTSPCGVQTEWANVRVQNPYSGCYEYSGNSSYRTYNDRFPLVKYFDYVDNDWYDKGSGNTSYLTGDAPAVLNCYKYSYTLTWEWNTTGGYGQNQTYPMTGASSKLSFGPQGSAGMYHLKIDNSSTIQYANAAGESYIFGSITNSVSGQTVKLPLCAVFIFKKFYYGGYATNTSDPKIYYFYPNNITSYYSGDIKSNPVSTPYWSNTATSRGMGFYPTGNFDNSWCSYGTDTVNGASLETFRREWGNSDKYNFDVPYHLSTKSYGGLYFYDAYPAYYDGVLHYEDENN